MTQRMLDRRRFLEASARHGLTAATVCAAAGALWNETALAQAARTEDEKARAAKHTFIFATEYRIEDWVKYPVMQHRFKENIEAATNGEMYVRLHPAGQLGVGAALAQRIQGGTVHGGAVSLSNFSPYAPSVDLINIPFWCGENQRFANLVTSKVWADDITPKINARGYRPLFYFTVDPRTVAVRRGGRAVRTPEDMRGIKMRVPPSQLLQQFYRLAGANPTVIAWGETPAAMKQGVADALDPSIGALSLFGFQEVLENITTLRSVPDAQMFAANLAWYQALPKPIQDRFDDAIAKTEAETFAQIPRSRVEAMKIMTDAGCKFINPNQAEYRQWVEACGAQRAEWAEFKTRLAGSVANFEKLAEAANTKGRITVDDWTG